MKSASWQNECCEPPEAVVMVLDHKGAIERASPSFYDLIGLPYSNARDQVPFLKYVSDTERTVASVAIERATKGQDTKGAHFSLQAIDRKLRALRWSFTVCTMRTDTSIGSSPSAST